MKKFLITILLLSGTFLFPTVQAEITIYGKVTFDGKYSGELTNKDLMLKFPSLAGLVEPAPYFVARVYPRGSKSKRLNLAIKSDGYDGTGNALTVEATDGREMMTTCSGIYDAPGKRLTSKKDLYVAFCLYTAPDSGSYFLSLWNNTKKKGNKQKIKLEPGKWQVVKARIYGPNFFDAGDMLSSISVYNVALTKRSWLIDNFVVWSGEDTTPPSTVSDVHAKNAGSENIISWKASSDNLFVVKYKIYRGSIPDFVPGDSSYIGHTTTLSFRDTTLMRISYYYKVVAEDVSGNCSAPSTSAKTQ